MEQLESQPPSRGAATRWAVRALALAAVALSAVSVLPPDHPSAPPAPPPAQRPAGELHVFRPVDARALVRVLDAAWAEVGRPGAVPNVAPASLPADMASLPVAERKRAFVRSVLPWVLEANRAIAVERRALEAVARGLDRGRRLAVLDRLWLGDMVREYRLSDDERWSLTERPALVVAELLRRVDRIPPSLAVAQAAIETGWGCSRFVREGNALFGQWVFSAAGGIVPRGRPEGARYSVARFDHLGASAVSYFRNLNTSWAYEGLRAARARLRASGARLGGDLLAPGLVLYSQRREAYVDEVSRIIRRNRLDRYDDIELVALPADRRAAVLGEAGQVLTDLERRRLPDA